ncbi:MAG: hypothetical protein HY329_26060, partial [Chloroflexi bacterium]|nr:hypothetical protein [Chloroflexota bacterium]
PTVTATPTPLTCYLSINIPPLENNTGYYYTITTSGTGDITATWTWADRNQDDLLIYAGNPFVGQPNPTLPGTDPEHGDITNEKDNRTTFSVTASSQPAGTYTVYFWNRGDAGTGGSTAVITYKKASCP